MKTNIYKKTVLIFLIVAMALFAALIFVGCKKTFFVSPKLSYDAEKEIVKWDKVKSAREYVVNVYKGEYADRQMLLISVVEKKLEHSLVEYNDIITVGVSCVASGSHLASSERLICIDLKNKVVIGNGDLNNGKGDDLTAAPIIPMNFFNTKSNIYYSCSLAQDVEIRGFKGNVSNVVAFELKQRHWSVAESGDGMFTLTIKKEYFKLFTEGAKINFKAMAVGEPLTEFYVSIVSNRPYSIRDKKQPDVTSGITFTKSESKLGLDLSLFDENGKAYDNSAGKGTIRKVCIDGKEVVHDKLDSITIRKEVLDALPVGEHMLQVYSDYGKSETLLTIASSVNIAASDLYVDFETNYPFCYLRWDSLNIAQKDVTDIYVLINNEKYSINDSQYRAFFEGNSLNLSKLALPQSLVLSVTYIIGDAEYTSYSIKYETPDHSAYVEYFTKTFDYFGKAVNAYLTSDSEIHEFVHALILNFSSLRDYEGDLTDPKSKRFEKVIQIYYDGEALDLRDKIDKYRKSFPEAVAWDYNLVAYKGERQNELLFCVSMRSTLDPNIVTDAPSCDTEEKNPDTLIGSGARTREYDSYLDVPFKIKSNSNLHIVKNTTEMFMAMERGLRPSTKVGSTAERVYSSAEKTLYSIVDDTMNDYEKVAAIFSWLGTNVMYDYAVAEKTGSILPSDDRYTELYFNKSFFAEGVFDNNLAVCNGIAQAFVIMCRIEGIEAYKVSGSANGGAHAWNKVYIDGNWYVIDPTWASKAIDDNGDSIEDREFLSFNTLFMSTISSGSAATHNESSASALLKFYAGDVQFNWYANLFYMDDSGSYIGQETDEKPPVLVVGGADTDTGDQEPATIDKINDKVFRGSDEANKYIALQATNHLSTESFLISFLTRDNKLGIGNLQSSEYIELPAELKEKFEMEFLVTHANVFTGIGKFSGQKYQYATTTVYWLHIIKLTPKAV